MATQPKQFVLLTAAKNEERYIEKALSSVVRQTVHPVVWFIVDDGSDDRTAEIIKEFAKKHSFIRLISKEGRSARSFGAQYRALNQAYDHVRRESFDFVGVQDADIAVEREDYYEQVISAFGHEEALGIAGGWIVERKRGKWRPRVGNSRDAVAGGIQMFRRVCFEQIEGYKPLQFGGEDWLAQIEAKRFGWSVAALPCLAARHYRPTSSADGRLKGLFRLGRMDAAFGSHPLFELLKCGRRLREEPIVVGSAIRWLGFVWEVLLGGGPQLAEEQVAYLRERNRKKKSQRGPGRCFRGYYL